MSTPFSESQVNRLAQFRRNRRFAAEANPSSSDTSPPSRADPVSSSTGAPDDLSILNAALFPSAAIRDQKLVAAPFVKPAILTGSTLQPPPPSLFQQNSPAISAIPSATAQIAGAASAAKPVTPSARRASVTIPTTLSVPQPSDIVTSSGSRVTAPGDELAAYILDLERQNAELREHVQFLQNALRSNGVETSAVSPDLSTTLGGGQEGISSSGAPAATAAMTEHDKQMFLTEVMSQVDIIVQAHKNRSAVEIEKHKRDAEEARRNLQQLRDAIHQEGLDLSIAPASVLMRRKYAEAIRSVERERDADADAASGQNAVDTLELPAEAHHLLDSVVEDFLDRLAKLQEGEDLAENVRNAVKVNFRAMVDFFSAQLVDRAKDLLSEVDSLKEEIMATREKGRTMLAASESERVVAGERYEAQLQALRDELRAYHLAAAHQDDVQATMQERALDEYTAMLVSARQESTQLKRLLEEERNHAAEVCLKLKSALHKRNLEFEQELTKKAEQIIEVKEKQIADLHVQLRGQREAHEAAVNRGKMMRRDVACQCDPLRPTVHPVSERSFIPNIVQAAQRATSKASKVDDSALNSSSVVGSPAQLPSDSRFVKSSFDSHTHTPSTTGRTNMSALDTSSGSYEHQILRKTQELLNRYGIAATPR